MRTASERPVYSRLYLSGRSGDRAKVQRFLHSKNWRRVISGAFYQINKYCTPEADRKGQFFIVSLF